ncbi:MAG: hypothetical protein JNM41_03355 [Flavipsychrobacter sp.]|nr:hypothetical protein [Flavipsychrobacter sp.]
MKHKVEIDNVVIPEFKSDRLLQKPISLHPEAAAFLFHIDGCARKLLTYIIFFEVDIESCLFAFNAKVIYNFNEYCNMFGSAYSDKVIRKAIGQLSRRNVAISTARGTYMLNPLLYGGISPGTRKELITKYGSYLLKKKKDVAECSYPIYTRSKPTRSHTGAPK